MRIGVVAPSCRIDEDVVDRVSALAKGRAELVWHPQCFESHYHFAGSDWSRRDAFVAMANDPTIDAIWFARGGYGAVRIMSAMTELGPAARTKSYLGYSDAGYLLAALYTRGIGQVFHGPMPADIRREGGETAVSRALDWLVDRDPAALERSVGTIPHGPTLPLTWIEARERANDPPPTIALNICILAHLIGTPEMPDLDQHVVMLEEVGEYAYRTDRDLAQIVQSLWMSGLWGYMNGRISQIVPNDPEFELDDWDLVQHWAGAQWIGPADIGHDIDNKVVPFGRLPQPA